MKSFLIAGAIIDDGSNAWCYEDVTPTQINSFLNGLEEGEDVTFDISSCGGSCTAGLAICNMIKQARLNGHHTTAHVIGIAASMASVIACSCDELKIDSNAFLMCHLPYTTITGNSEDLKKEVGDLEKFEQALISIYKTKFDMTDEQIRQMLVEETWIIGEQTETFKLKCEVIQVDEPLKAAAYLNPVKDFSKTPSLIKDLIEEQHGNDQEKVSGQQELPLTVTLVECEKRVSGMQSKMAKQIDALKKDYEGRVNDLTVQLQAKTEELTKANGMVINLQNDLDKVTSELHKVASALDEKQTALDTLNASVNTPSCNDGTDWKLLKGKDFFDWLKTQDISKITKEI